MQALGVQAERRKFTHVVYQAAQGVKHNEWWWPRSCWLTLKEVQERFWKAVDAQKSIPQTGWLSIHAADQASKMCQMEVHFHLVHYCKEARPEEDVCCQFVQELATRLQCTKKVTHYNWQWNHVSNTLAKHHRDNHWIVVAVRESDDQTEAVRDEANEINSKKKFKLF